MAKSTPIALVVISAIVMAVSFLGCWGAFKMDRW